MPDPVLSYAGVFLPVPSAALSAWCEKTVRPADAYAFDPGRADDRVAHLPIPDAVPPSPVRLGVLYWPRGASRWSVYHGVLAGKDLVALRAACLVGGSENGGYRSKPFRLGDGVNDPIETDLTLLPPVPLAVGNDPTALAALSTAERAAAEANDLYLITLVDARYFWWNASLPEVDTASWASLIVDVEDALSETLETGGSIDAAWLAPSDAWGVEYPPVPPYLDALAYAIGRRVVRLLDGTVYLESWDEAKTTTDDLWALGWDYNGGGVVAAADLRRDVPASVDVVFDGEAVNKTLSSLAIAEYASATGRAGDVGLVAAATVTGSDTDGYATEAAKAFYGWRLADVDVVFAGWRDYTPNGFADAIEWTHAGPAAGTTRVFRGPFGPARPNLPGVAADASFLAVLVDKDFGGPFIRYSWRRVRDVVDGGDGSGGDACEHPDYDLTALPGSGSGADDPDAGVCGVDYGGLMDGGECCWPAYHTQNRDLPVYAYLDDEGSGSGSGAGDAAPIPPECVYRLRKGKGEWYYVDPPPLWEFVYKLADAPEIEQDGVTYYQGFVVRYDQDGKALENKEECLIIEAGDVG